MIFFAAEAVLLRRFVRARTLNIFSDGVTLTEVEDTDKWDCAFRAPWTAAKSVNARAYFFRRVHALHAAAAEDPSAGTSMYAAFYGAIDEALKMEERCRSQGRHDTVGKYTHTHQWPDRVVQSPGWETEKSTSHCQPDALGGRARALRGQGSRYMISVVLGGAPRRSYT